MVEFVRCRAAAQVLFCRLRLRERSASDRRETQNAPTPKPGERKRRNE
jgi:hypothetical protein